jgi:hypothetical protein
MYRGFATFAITQLRHLTELSPNFLHSVSFMMGPDILHRNFPMEILQLFFLNSLTVGSSGSAS